MVALVALVPCAVVIVTILVLRRGGVAAAGAAAVAALIIWLLGLFSAPATAQLGTALVDAAILELLVAAIIVPGILFVEVSGRAGAPGAIRDITRSLELSPPKTAILIATGFGVTVESLTGLGVSLLITVPLLVSTFARHQAIGLALIGMSLMPWGALSVSAHLGAGLAGIPLDSLAALISRVSGPIALILPLLCLLFVPRPSGNDFLFAAAAGLLLASAIALSAHWIGIEIAGVAGGISVIALAIASAAARSGLGRLLGSAAIRPYWLLIAAVIVQKAVLAPLGALGIAPVISSGRVSFAVMTSPGLALLAASLFCLALVRPNPPGTQSASALVLTVCLRAWRPLASIFLFMLSARFLVEAGAIQALADLLAGLGVYPALAAVILLGAMSGFVTGGGVAGNALFMPSAAATGASFDAVALFGALQNGAAAHMAMAALPIAAILLAALPDHAPEDDRNVLKTGLGLGFGYLLILLAVGAFLFHAGFHRA